MSPTPALSKTGSAVPSVPRKPGVKYHRDVARVMA